MVRFFIIISCIFIFLSCKDAINLNSPSSNDQFCLNHPDSVEKASLDFLKCKEREADLHTQTGWEEYNNVFHFERSLQIYKEIQKKSENLELTSEVEEFKKNIQEKIELSKSRKEAFNHYKRNHFPMAFFKSKDLTFQGKYKDKDYFAIDGLIEELHENIIKLSQGKGQIPIYIINKDDKVKKDVLEYTFSKLTNIPPQFTPTSEEIIKIIPESEKGETAKYIKNNNLEKLDIFFQNNLYDTVSFLIIENCGTLDNYTSFFIGELYLLKKENNKLSLHAVSIVDSPGRNLQEPFKNSIYSMKIFIAMVVLLLIIWFIWNEFNSNLEQSPKQKLKTFFIYLFSFVFFGIGMGHGIIYFSEFFIPPWDSPGKEDSISFFVILLVFLFTILAFISFLLSKVEDSALFTRNRYYLSFYFAIVFMGLGGFLEFNLHYYYSIYPMDGKLEYNSLIYIIRFFSPILGFGFGSAERDLLFHNSISDLYKTNSNKKFSSLQVYVVFLVFLLLPPIIEVIFIRSFLIVSNVQNYQFYLLPYSILLFIQFSYSNSYNKDVINLKRNKEKRDFKIPEKLNELETLLKNPEHIDYSPLLENSKNLDTSNKKDLISLFENIQNKIIDAMQLEGGIIVVQGKEGSGKTNFAFDLTSNQRLDKCLTYHVKFSDSSLDNDPFLPFLQSMKGIPEIRSIHEMIRLGANANVVGGKLSGLVEHIPFVGGLLKFIFQSDTKLNLNSEENIIKLIANYILQHSREQLYEFGEFDPNKNNLLKKLFKNNEPEDKTKPATPDGGIVFILDDFQKINRECYQLILKIMEILQDDDLSPETNKLCFLLVLDSDESFSFEKARSLLKISQYTYTHKGITLNQLEDIYYNKLNMSFSTEPFFYEILSLSGKISYEENKEEDFINPYLFFINLREQLENFKDIEKDKEKKFSLKQNSTRKITFSMEIMEFFKQNKKLSKINLIQEEILQKSSLIGEKFSILELACLFDSSYFDTLVYELDKLSNTENSIIIEINEGLYEFRDELTRRILFETFSYRVSLNSSTQEENSLKFILSLNYNKLLNLYQNKLSENIIDLDKKYAKIYMYFYKVNLEKAFEFNLKLLENLHKKLSENIVHSQKRILEKEILDSLRDINLLFRNNLDLNSLENSTLLSILAYMETEKQGILFEIVPEIDKLYSHILANKDIFINVNLISFIEIVYNSMRIKLFKDISIPSVDEIIQLLNNYKSNSTDPILNIASNFWIGNFYKFRKEFSNAIQCFENNDYNLLFNKNENKFLYSKLHNSKFECFVNLVLSKNELDEFNFKNLPEIDFELQKCLTANQLIKNEHGDIKVISHYLNFLMKCNIKTNDSYRQKFIEMNEELLRKSQKIKSTKGIKDYEMNKNYIESKE
jgi:hypothetical protein